MESLTSPPHNFGNPSLHIYTSGTGVPDHVQVVAQPAPAPASVGDALVYATDSTLSPFRPVIATIQSASTAPVATTAAPTAGTVWTSMRNN